MVMWKKYVTVLVTISLLLVSACSGPVAKKSEAKKQELMFNTNTPNNDWLFQVGDWLAKEVDKQTNGSVKITLYTGGSLPYKQEEQLDTVDKGIVNMSWVILSAVAATEPILQVLDLPGVIPQDPEKRMKFASKLLPELKKHIESKYNVYVYAVHIREPRNIYLNKEVPNLEAMKGKKLRALGKIESQLTQKIGAVPVTVSWPETYSAIQQGVIDGMWIVDSAMYDNKMYEVSNSIVRLGLGGAVEILAINKEVYDKFSPEVQKIFQQLQPGYEAKEAEDYQKIVSDYQERLHQKGMKEMKWSNDQLGKVRDISESIAADWLKNASAVQKQFYETVQKLKE